MISNCTGKVGLQVGLQQILAKLLILLEKGAKVTGYSKNQFDRPSLQKVRFDFAASNFLL